MKVAINIKKYFFSLAGIFFAGAVSAQSLSPEDIARMLDDQASTPNPYAALLNDPDPKRSLGAMKIMMESGDQDLVDLALEFGLFSSDPRVRRNAVEYYMASEPFLAASFDGAETKARNYFNTIVSDLNGTMDVGNIGYVTFKVGSYDPENRCYLNAGFANCLITFRPDGVFLDGSFVKARLEITEDGYFVGSSTLHNVVDPIPLRIRLLE